MSESVLVETETRPGGAVVKESGSWIMVLSPPVALGGPDEAGDTPPPPQEVWAGAWEANPFYSGLALGSVPKMQISAGLLGAPPHDLNALSLLLQL